MRINAAVVFLLLLLSLAVLAWGGQMKTNNEAQAKIQALSEKIAKGEIGRVDIYQIPPRVLTRTRITQEMLEKQFHFRLTIRDIRVGVQKEKLIEATKSVVVQPQSELADLRWGVVFYDMDEIRAAALYFDKKGSSGAVGETPVSFKGAFFKWLDGNFSSCFR